MKKFISLLVVALMGVVMFASCAGNGNSASGQGGGNSGGSVEIYLASFEGAYGSEFWGEVIAGYEEMYKEEGYTVRLESSSKIDEIVTPQIRNGEGPDVMYYGTNQPSGFTNKLIASGSLLNLTDLLEENVPGEDVKIKDKILPGFLDTTSTMPYNDGDTFMMPLFYSTNGLFYNTDLFNEDGSGGKYKLPVTWDDFYALGEQANEDDRKLFIYPRAGYLDNMMFAEVANSAGIEVLQDWLNFEDVYSNPDFMAVFEKLAGLKPYFAWDVYDAAKHTDNQARVLSNEVLFVPSGSWMPDEMADYTPASGFNYGYMAPPSFSADGDRYATGMMEQIFALRSGDEAKEAASRAFISYIYSDAAVKAIVGKSGGFVPTSNVIDIAKEVGVDELTITMYSLYEDNVKFVAGEFVAANAEGVNWKQTYCFSMDSIMQGEAGADAQWWLDRMQSDAALLKEGIQQQ